MEKSGLRYRMLAAVCAVVAITLIQMSLSRQVGSATSAGADISSEGRTVETYVNDLGSFNGKWVELGKRSSFTHTDFDPVQRNADDLKKRLSEVQNAVKEIIRKLKASGEWNDADAIVLSKITEARAQSRFRQTSFKVLLEESSTQLTSDANEISSPLDSLRSRLSARAGDLQWDSSGSNLRLINAAYSPPAPALKQSLVCRLTQIGLGVSGFIHGNPTEKAYEANNCACGGTGCFVW